MATTAFAFVTQSAAIAVKGIPVSIVEGDAWVADDPVVKAYPSFFSDTPNTVKHSTIAASAKKRRTRRKKTDENTDDGSDTSESSNTDDGSDDSVSTPDGEGSSDTESADDTSGDSED